MRRFLWLLLFVAAAIAPLGAQSAASAAPDASHSVYPLRPEDPHAAYLQPGSFGAIADGHADDTAAIQAAIDHVQETTGEGIVFVAEGRYRIGHTVYLWSGIRLIGYGAHRPVFVLGRNTPGYQQGHGVLGTGRYMLQFAERLPPQGKPVVDANEFTFYSGIFNIDFEIGPGNPSCHRHPISRGAALVPRAHSLPVG